MVDYLVNSCGFTRDKAHSLSSNLTHLNDIEKPASVITFLKHSSLSDTQIRNLITKKPKLLCASVDRTLKPKIRVFQDLGMSASDIAKLISKNPYLLLHISTERHISPCIDFLRTILLNNENQVKMEPLEIALYPQFLSLSAEKRIIPRRNLMQILKSNKLVKRDYSLFSLFFTSEKKFSERFVIPYMDKIPDVCEAYMRTVGVGLPSMK